jgi:hypothetical protein
VTIDLILELTARVVLYCFVKNIPRFVEIIAGIKQAIDFHAAARPFLYFVDAARRVFGFFVRPCRTSALVGQNGLIVQELLLKH